MEELNTEVEEFYQRLKTFQAHIENALLLVEKKKQDVIAIVKDKVKLDEQEKDLLAREEALKAAQMLHETAVKDDAERKRMLDIKERQLNAEKQRFQGLIDSL